MEIFYLLSVFLLFGALIKSTKQKFYLFTSFVILFVFSAFRDTSVGTDTAGYEQLFLRLQSGISIRQEIGWQYLNKIIIYFGGEFEHLLIVSSLLVLFPVFYVVYKHSLNPMLSIFLYFALYIYLQSFNITRQTLAVSIVFFAYTFLLKERYWYYCLIVIIASFFHTTALLCIPLVFINRIPNRIPIYLTLIVGSMLIGTFFSGFIIEKSAHLFGYTHYLDRFESGVGTGIFLLALNAFAIFVILTAKNKNDLFKLFVIYIVFANFASAVPFGYRVIYYFSIIQILFLPTFISFNELKSKGVSFFLVVLYAYISFSRSAGSGEVVPYINTLF